MDYDLLVDAIYEAGAHPEQWDGVLALLTASFRGVCAAMHIGDVSSDFAFGATYRLNPEASDAYAKHYFAINPLNEPLTRVPTGTAVGDNQLVPRAAYHGSEFYNDYSLRFQLNGSITAVLENRDGHVSCLGVVTATGTDPHSPDEVAAFQRLIPHIRRALDLNKQFAGLKDRVALATSGLNQLDFGMAFLDTGGTIVAANTAAEAIFSANDGLRAVRGRLRVSDRAVQERLNYVVDCAARGIGPRGGSLKIPRAGDKPPLFVRATPFRGEKLKDMKEVRVVLAFRDPQNSTRGGTDLIASAFGLTPAEARVLRALVDEPDAKKIADRFDVSLVTVRNQIARMLQKTGTTKQSELIKLVLTNDIPIL
ncbi:putative transcriptional regulator, LuxR/FixJ family of response regulator [Hyphomicrobium sp. GJ21]|uniref:helix-turn-helix transcriptional regulator n=1 Tax=Hyphomicrobium sp. GJ21 TaxID=113574 RepID=UPI000622BE57|nr:LuxR C-terminal-related transcriptional regulator [Hyphomicrobium sp. GJ21]CEJ84417.1 putative transcriptional regulator, LuxR/FixJ family of response regulator [Hyphomicrobium sp. GJ21]